MCLVVAGHPFDLIKTRLQAMQVVPGQTPPYTGAIDAFRKTLAKEGVRAAAAGSRPPTHPHCPRSPRACTRA